MHLSKHLGSVLKKSNRKNVKFVLAVLDRVLTFLQDERNLKKKNQRRNFYIKLTITKQIGNTSTSNNNQFSLFENYQIKKNTPFSFSNTYFTVSTKTT